METSIWRALFYLVGIMAFAGLNAAYLGWCERKGRGPNPTADRAVRGRVMPACCSPWPTASS